MTKENKDKRDKKDVVIKVILIIIIILLLLHNCSLIRNRYKQKTPGGNINIIEITCEDNNKCDVDDDKSQVSQDGKKALDQDYHDGTAKVNGDASSKTGSDDFDVDTSDELTIFDNELVWRDSASLNIFTDSVYHFDDKVAPGSSNTYQFVVKNSTKYRLKYEINFIETNLHQMNMKYKLKKNDSYVIDHYVSCDELHLDEQLLSAKSNDTYYLEWKWIDSDNDTSVGNVQADYSLKIEVKAESVS